MPTRKEPAATVTIGGREVPLLKAALIAQEADCLGVLPHQVGDVVIPQPAPAHVMIADLRLSIAAGAEIAAAADARGVHPVRVIQSIVRDYAKSLNKRIRKQETTRAPDATSAISGPPGGDDDDA
jgi:hypothetical protein